MIHYHGGPIWPERAAAEIWTGRHAFISFARPEQIGVAAETSQSFSLDNGAFSLLKSGKKTNWMEYYLWVNSWMPHPGFDWALIPDVINGSETDNHRLLLEWPFGNIVGVPVWHVNETIIRLQNLCNKYPRVAIGSSGEYFTVGNRKWWKRIADAMDIICDKDGRPPCKLHGLRMLNPEVFSRLPFSSCDSTNVAQNCRDSKKWNTYKPPNNTSRGIVLANRIEAFNSSPLWDRDNLPF